MEKVLKFNDEAIRQLFLQYIESYEDRERHSPEAVRCAEGFDDFCSKHIEGSMRKKIEAYTKMTDVAVEFEESGFIAGFKVAMNLIFSEDDTVQTELEAEKAQEQILDGKATIPIQETEKSQHETVQDSQKHFKRDDCYITSLQIGELFNTPNWKVVKRIDDRIMPLLDKESQAMFHKETGMNCQNKPVTFYRLNRAACMMYLEIMEPKKKQFISATGGYAKLQELMQRTFHTEMVPLPT